MTSRKDEILRLHSISAAKAARLLAISIEDCGELAQGKRAVDELFGVWSSDASAFVYPYFQFGEKSNAGWRKKLFQILRTRVGFDPLTEDKGGWARAYWLYQPNRALSKRALATCNIAVADPVAAAQVLALISEDARTPAEVFVENPEAVIDLAAQLAR